MLDAVIENGVQVIGAILVMLIGVLGTWLTAKIGKREELHNINAAQEEAIKMAQQTVLELQQVVVDNLKSSKEDGKLTDAEIKALGEALKDTTIKKMSSQAIAILNAAGVDLSALIAGAGEAWINKIKGSGNELN